MPYLKVMDVPTWLQVAVLQAAGALTLAGLAAAAFVWACVCAARLERDDEDGDPSYSVPWWMVTAWLLPVILAAWALWSATR